MRLLGDWNWWLPRWLGWLPHVTIEGELPEHEAGPRNGGGHREQKSRREGSGRSKAGVTSARSDGRHDPFDALDRSTLRSATGNRRVDQRQAPIDRGTTGRHLGYPLRLSGPVAQWQSN